MPIIDDVELPIRYQRISGPAIDALERRREEGSDTPITNEGLKANFDFLRDSIACALKSIVAAGDKLVR